MRAGPLLLLACLVIADSAAAQQRLFAGGSWAALRFAAECEASARPLPPAANREPAARAGFRFDARSGAQQFHVRLSRGARPGSSVMLTVGDRPFLLVGRGEWAWSNGPAQAAAIAAAVRRARGMRVEARSPSGGRFTDRYLLNGAPTAIDAAAAGCTGKIPPQ